MLTCMCSECGWGGKRLTCMCVVSVGGVGS